MRIAETRCPCIDMHVHRYVHSISPRLFRAGPCLHMFEDKAASETTPNKWRVGPGSLVMMIDDDG